MKILKAPFGFVDIFGGMGWEQHTRLRQVKVPNGKKFVYISGARLNHNQLSKVEQKCK